MQDVFVPESIHCQDTQWTNPAHSSDRDSMVLDMLSSMIEVSHSKIPMVGGISVQTGCKIKPGSIPGWKEQVGPFQEDARFWYSVWRSADRPHTGVLHDIMSKTRNIYHYAVRRVKKMSDLVRSKKLFEASQAGSQNLLQELKKVSHAKK